LDSFIYLLIHRILLGGCLLVFPPFTTGLTYSLSAARSYKPFWFAPRLFVFCIPLAPPTSLDFPLSGTGWLRRFLLNPEKDPLACLIASLFYVNFCLFFSLFLPLPVLLLTIEGAFLVFFPFSTFSSKLLASVPEIASNRNWDSTYFLGAVSFCRSFEEFFGEALIAVHRESSAATPLFFPRAPFQTFPSRLKHGGRPLPPHPSSEMDETCSAGDFLPRKMIEFPQVGGWWWFLLLWCPTWAIFFVSILRLAFWAVTPPLSFPGRLTDARLWFRLVYFLFFPMEPAGNWLSPGPLYATISMIVFHSNMRREPSFDLFLLIVWSRHE